MLNERLLKFAEFVAALGIYIVLFYSIFDVYYTSPLTRGVSPVDVNINPPASHLVFIVSDGLRADKLFTHSMENTPFIKDLLLNHAAWGLSHTRVPTESRPGHVAMLGGFYEDVASVTKGWQANAVEFDSLFNRTLRGWAWGTHEVVQLFAHDRPNHVQITSSPEEFGDLTKHNITEIDTWAVDRFIESVNDKETGFFANDSSARASEPDLTRRGHLAFIHLDAADHIGHSHKPGSAEYVEMIRHVDTQLARIVHAVNKSGTDSVAFVFTADHGMTDWGSHGAGSLHETVTPLLVWGKGVVKPEPTHASLHTTETDQYGLPVHNYGRRRREMRQADLCPLMAGLLGVPIPSNSVGRVPLEFLALNSSDGVKLVRANCIQILAQLREKKSEKERSHFALFFKEYRPLTSMDATRRLQLAESLETEGKYSEAITIYEKLTDVALDALNYYHKYDRPFLGFCIASIFCLWSLVILCTLVGPVGDAPSKHAIKSQLTGSGGAQSVVIWLSALLGIGLICLVIAFSHLWPITHSIYQLVPLILFLYLICSPDRRARIGQLCRRLTVGHAFPISQPIKGSRYLVCWFGLVVFALLELIILGFLYRPLLSVACVIVALWPAFDATFGARRTRLRRLWSVACLTLAGFPLLPVIGSTFNPLLVCISGLVIACVGYICFRWWLCGSPKSHAGCDSGAMVSHIDLQLGLAIMIASFSVYAIHSKWTYAPLLQFPIHLFSWSILVVLPLTVLRSVPPRLGPRVLAWIGVFVTPLILLSTHYEGIFILVFITVCLLWIQMEAPELTSTMIWDIDTVRESDHSSVARHAVDHDSASLDLLTLRNFRQSIFFIFLLVISFFGTGNIASVNSFDPRSTFCFITSLKPAIMGFLLLVKVLCPAICLGVVYGAVQLASGHTKSVSPLYAPTLDVISTQTGLSAVMSNFIAMHFFAWLRDEGSWLEIGNSISHYVIAMAFGLAAFLFARFGRMMLTCHPTWIARYVGQEWRKQV